MEILEAKRLVIEAGEKLVETGLIARTWGNVSCRVDDKTFVITPSGKSYIGLTPEDIVEVAVENLAWSGDVKPSSEKGIHAQVYKIYPDANFVIHTHQKNASSISVLKKGVENLTGEAREIIGDNIPLGGYGLPGTKTLRKGVTNALMSSPSKAIVMSHHGALCYGKDFDEAFKVADCLEKTSAQYILASAKSKLGIVAENLDEFCDKLVIKLANAKQTTNVDRSKIYNSTLDRESGKIIFTNQENGSEIFMDLSSGSANADVSPTAEAHRSVYLASKKFNYILHNADKETVAVSLLEKKMKPLLDDFAQICGTRVKRVEKPEKCGKAIKGKNAVLLKGSGALCAASVEGDAQAVSMIMSKASLAQLTTKVCDASKPINIVESFLMRIVYLKKYSKQAAK